MRFFEVQPLPDNDERMALAAKLDLTPRSVQVWFQNRRQRTKPGYAPSATSKAARALVTMLGRPPRGLAKASRDGAYKRLREVLAASSATATSVSDSMPNVPPTPPLFETFGPLSTVATAATAAPLASPPLELDVQPPRAVSFSAQQEQQQQGQQKEQQQQHAAFAAAAAGTTVTAARAAAAGGDASLCSRAFAGALPDAAQAAHEDRSGLETAAGLRTQRHYGPQPCLGARAPHQHLPRVHGATTASIVLLAATAAERARTRDCRLRGRAAPSASHRGARRTNRRGGRSELTAPASFDLVPNLRAHRACFLRLGDGTI